MLPCRVHVDGTVTSACVEADVNRAIASSVRKALLSRRFAPAMAAGVPAAVLVRHELERERRDRDPVPPARLDDIEWLEAVVDGLQADVGTQRRLPVSERDSPALRRAAYARLGDIGSDEGLRAVERIALRHAPAAGAAIGSDPLRAALFAHFTLADRNGALSIELGHDEVPIDGYRGAGRCDRDNPGTAGASPHTRSVGRVRNDRPGLPAPDGGTLGGRRAPAHVDQLTRLRAASPVDRGP